jgi:RND family efflux transporter MFP subunit
MEPLTRLAGALGTLSLAVTLAACVPGEKEGAEDRGPQAVPAVEALPARSGTLPLEERVSGRVRSHNQVVIRAEIEAPIVEVMAASGAAVERGQPLVRLDDNALREQLRQAEANLRLTEAEAAEARARVAELEAQVVRTRALAAEELVSELELETQEARRAAGKAGAEAAEARVDQARATVDERRDALGKTLVRAPVSGHVGQRNAEVGMIADPATPLFVVGDLSELIVEIPLTESMLSYVRSGLPVRVTAQSLAQPLRAELSRVSPFLAAGSFSTVGEVDVANPDGRLQPGMFVTVDVLYGESERATLVPASALWEDPRSGVVGVYVVDMAGAVPASTELSDEERGVEFRPVDVLAEGAATVGLRGVEQDEWVVTVGQHLLHGQDAQSARVRPTSWERVLELQGLQREDVLRGFLDKQQRLARRRGAEPPTNREFLNAGP